ncbi:MAG: taurine ABC transporter substrate-binding protein [Pseudomonadota bacterium]|nr:taurine ABC transporter substrate-binding protein [Pseudomonadota bacterium]
MTVRTLKMALDRYDRHIPFFLGLVDAPKGIEIEALEVGMVPPRRDGVDRHRRMLVDLEFDIAEVSLASYVMARQRGVRLTAVPAFPRRLFSQNHIFVETGSGFTSPVQLSGKRIAIWAFQVTMSVLAKGDLKSEYGLDWRDVEWVTQRPEEIPWQGAAENIVRMPEGRTGAEMLLAGEVDAYIDPHPPPTILENDRIRRLFPDARMECRKYWEKHGHYPIMHLLAMRDPVVEEFPELPFQLLQMWDDARDQAYEYYIDHNYTVLPFGRYAFDSGLKTFDGELWPSGLSVNSANLDQFIGYMVDQELLGGGISVDTLFHNSVLDT